MPSPDPSVFFESCILRRRSSSRALDRSGLSDQSVDWIASIRRANEEFAVPALATTVSELRIEESLPEDVPDYLSMLLAGNVERNERARAQCIRVGEILTSVGSQAVLLKGAAWLFDEGPSRCDRMMRDIDILIAEEHRETVTAALRAAGYGASHVLQEPGHVHDAPLYIAGGLLLEVHVELTTRSHMLTAREVIATAIPVASGLAIPSPCDRIIHNVLHAQIVNGDYLGGAVSLRDCLDLSRLIAAHFDAIDWPLLAEESRQRGYFRELSGALHLAATFGGAPLPRNFAADAAGARHAARCGRQWRWPLADRLLRKYGVLRRALAWERDSYALTLGTDKGFRAHLSVNARRARRAWAAVRRSLAEH